MKYEMTIGQESVCPYCEWKFTVTPRHIAENLYARSRDNNLHLCCSKGCRQLTQEKHVPFEERHIEFQDEHFKLLATEDGKKTGADYYEFASPLEIEWLDELPPLMLEKLQEFFKRWLYFNNTIRDAIALKLHCPKGSYRDIGALRGITAQAVHKEVKKLAVRNPRLAKMLSVDVHTGREDDPNQTSLSLN